MSLWIWVCWKVWRAQKAKREMQLSKEETPVATSAATRAPGVCAMKKERRNAELWIGTRGQGRAGVLRDFHITPATPRVLSWWPRRERPEPDPSPRSPSSARARRAAQLEISSPGEVAGCPFENIATLCLFRHLNSLLQPPRSFITGNQGQ